MAKWAKKLKEIESHLSFLFKGTSSLILEETKSVEVKSLEEAKNKLLLGEELDWHIKSRDTWIAEGDNNTKFFHSYAFDNKKTNMIWDLTDDHGARIHKFGDLASTGVRHFKHIFSKSLGNTLVSTMRVI